MVQPKPLLAEALELSVRLPYLVVAAEVLDSFAAIAVPEEPRRAAVLLGAGEGIRDKTGFAVYDREERERIVAASRADLDAAEFARRWADGRAMTLEEAAAYALGRASDA
jgi:hypothetical protein